MTLRGPLPARLSMEDFAALPTDVLPGFEKLLRVLNPFLADTVASIQSSTKTVAAVVESVESSVSPVCARYVQATVQTIDGGTGTVVNWETKQTDTHGAVQTGASWRFVAPRKAIYLVTCGVMLDLTGYSGNIQTNFQVRQYINNTGTPTTVRGSNYSDVDGSDSFNFAGTCLVNLAVGDGVDVVAAQHTGGPLRNTAGSAYSAWTYCDIVEIAPPT